MLSEFNYLSSSRHHQTDACFTIGMLSEYTLNSQSQIKTTSRFMLNQIILF
jgi:hypothetical protein